MSEPSVVARKTVHSGVRFTPTERDRIIGETIRSNREKLRLRQEDLAKKVGISKRTLIRYENAERPIVEQVLRRIEEIVGTSRPDVLPTKIAEEPGTYGRMSDPRSRMPPGLEGFLERFDRRLSHDEKAELRTRGGDFMRPLRQEPDDAYWWALVQLWRKYDPGPGREPSE